MNIRNLVKVGLFVLIAASLNACSGVKSYGNNATTAQQNDTKVIAGTQKISATGTLMAKNGGNPVVANNAQIVAEGISGQVAAKYRPNRQYARQPVRQQQYYRQPVRQQQYYRQPVRQQQYYRQPVRQQQYYRQPVRQQQYYRQPVRQQQYYRQPVRQQTPVTYQRYSG